MIGGGLTCYSTCRDHITCGNQFFSSTMWALKLRSSGLVTGILPLLFPPPSSSFSASSVQYLCSSESMVADQDVAMGPQDEQILSHGDSLINLSYFFLVSSRSQDPKPNSQRNCLINLRRFLEYHTSSFVSDFSPCWNKIPDESRLRK